MKDDSLSHLTKNYLASNNCLCHRNVFQNGFNSFFKKKKKKVNHFCQKSFKKNAYFVRINVSVCNCNIKCPIGKSIFTINLQLKIFHAAVANSDIGTQIFLHTLFTYLGQMLAKFQPKRRVKNKLKFWAFWQNTESF